MSKLQFDGGVILVTAPNPARNLRFNSPGQDVAPILPLLNKVGFEVELVFSKTSPTGNGFIIGQNENQPAKLSIIINPGFEGFELDQLKLTLRPQDQRKRNQRVD